MFSLRASPAKGRRAGIISPFHYCRMTGAVGTIASSVPLAAFVVPFVPAATSAPTFVAVAHVFVLTAAFAVDVAAALLVVFSRLRHCAAPFAFPAGAAPPCADAPGPASVGASEGLAGASCLLDDFHLE